MRYGGWRSQLTLHSLSFVTVFPLLSDYCFLHLPSSLPLLSTKSCCNCPPSLSTKSRCNCPPSLSTKSCCNSLPSSVGLYCFMYLPSLPSLVVTVCPLVSVYCFLHLPSLPSLVVTVCPLFVGALVSASSLSAKSYALSAVYVTPDRDTFCRICYAHSSFFDIINQL